MAAFKFNTLVQNIYLSNINYLHKFKYSFRKALDGFIANEIVDGWLILYMSVYKVRFYLLIERNLHQKCIRYSHSKVRCLEILPKIGINILEHIFSSFDRVTFRV